MGIPLVGKYNWYLQSFAEYIDNDTKGDDFEGFKIFYRLHDLHNGTGIFIAEATMQQKFLIMGQPSQRWENAM